MDDQNSAKNSLSTLPVSDFNPHPVLKVDSNGKILYANPAAGSLLKIMDVGVGDELPSDWKQYFIENFFNLSDKEFEAKAGHLIYSVTQVLVLQENIAYLFCFNITAIKSTQERLKESDERYRILAEFSGDLISHHDSEGRFIYVSPACKAILNYSPASILNTFLFDLIHQEDILLVKKIFSESFDEAGTAIFRMKNGDGNWIWIESRFRKFFNQKFSKNEVIAISRDVTDRKQKELLIKESEERFRGLLRASNEGILFHKEGMILDLNEKVQELYGYDYSEIVGKSIFDFIPIEEHQSVLDKIKNKSTETYLGKVKRKSGEVIQVEIKGSIQQYKGEEVRVVVLTDITQRLIAEDKVRKQQILMNNILDNLPINIYTKDREGRYVFINSYAADQLNLPKKSIIGKTYREIFPDGYYKDVIKGDELAWKNGQYFSEDRISYNGTAKHFMVGKFILSFETSNDPMLLGYSLDFTERKATESNLKNAKKLLEESIKAKERFISIMSHEIRTPMNAVVGITNLLLQQVADPEQKEYFNALKISSENLLKILNNVLDLSKIDSGKVSFEEIDFNLRNHLRKVKELFAFKAAEKNLKIKTYSDLSIPEVIKGDPHRLSQILVNLLSNSLKFTEEGEVFLEARILDETDDKVHILFVVEDTGIGIAEDKLQTIFESFSQADSDITRKYGGTGLGLTITKKLIELQGGRIGVESILGKGTKFMFDLYFYKSFLKAEMSMEYESISDFSGLKVLVVEDNSMNQLVVTKFLEKKGIAVIVAENGRRAIEILKKNTFDLVLMDLQMPELDGYQTSNYIRNELKQMELPIIAFTASSSSDIEKRVLDAGMNDYIVKPFEPSVFYSTISKHTGRKYIDQNAAMEKESGFKFINLNYLREASGNNESFIREMIRIFIRQTPDTLATLQNLLLEKNWDEFKGVIHKMKPTVAMMGIKEAETLVKLIEKQIKTETDKSKIGDELNQLSQICEASYRELDWVLSIDEKDPK